MLIELLHFPGLFKNNLFLTAVVAFETYSLIPCYNISCVCNAKGETNISLVVGTPVQIRIVFTLCEAINFCDANLFASAA